MHTHTCARALYTFDIWRPVMATGLMSGGAAANQGVWEWGTEEGQREGWGEGGKQV